MDAGNLPPSNMCQPKNSSSLFWGGHSYGSAQVFTFPFSPSTLNCVTSLPHTPINSADFLATKEGAGTNPPPHIPEGEETEAQRGLR